MNAPFRKPMTVAEFLAWAEARPAGRRYRLIDGEPVLMVERAGHLKAKGAVFRSLVEAVERAALPCHVLPDGITVVDDEYTPYEPDASIYCGEEIDDDAMVLPNPLIVVEVLSPSTAHVDTGAKLVGYFKIASVAHYLIVDPVRRRIERHSRAGAGRIETRVFESGDIDLDPPGISVAVDAILPATR